MSHSKIITDSGPAKLTKRQQAVIEDLFAGELDEQQVLQKHNIDCRLYDKWLAGVAFSAAFDRRMEAAYRQGELILARYAAVAAAKLVGLTESENQETARKACLDIINHLRAGTEPKQPSAAQAESMQDVPELEPETASKLLTALASDDKQGTSD